MRGFSDKEINNFSIEDITAIEKARLRLQEENAHQLGAIGIQLFNYQNLIQNVPIKPPAGSKKADIDEIANKKRIEAIDQIIERLTGVKIQKEREEDLKEWWFEMQRLKNRKVD